MLIFFLKWLRNSSNSRMARSAGDGCGYFGLEPTCSFSFLIWIIARLTPSAVAVRVTFQRCGRWLSGWLVLSPGAAVVAVPAISSNRVR